MENSNNQNNSKYEQDNLPKNLDQDKELAQADNRSESKSPKKSRSNSYSRHDISRRNSSDRSDYEQGQKKVTGIILKMFNHQVKKILI